MMANETETPEIGRRYIGNVMEQRDQIARDLPVSVLLAPVAAADTMVGSVAEILTLGAANPDSFRERIAPDFYMDHRYQADAIGSVGSMLFAGSWLTKLGRAEGLIAQASSAYGVDRAVGATAGRAINAGLGAVGKGPITKDHLFSQMSRVDEVDNMMAAARLQYSVISQGMLGANTPVLNMTARAPQALQQAARAPSWATYGDITRINNSDRSVQAVKDALWTEAAIFGLYNDSDFLFPDDAPAWTYALGAGLGVGLGVGIESFAGRAVMKRAMADAARAGQRAKTAFNAGRMAEGTGLNNVVGEDWMNAMTSLYGLSRVDSVEQQASAIVRNNPGISHEAVIGLARDARTAYNAQLNDSVMRMATQRLPANSLRGQDSVASEAVEKRSGVSVKEYVRPVVDRLKLNPDAGVALASITDPLAASRMSAKINVIQDRITNELRGMQNVTDQAAIDAAQTRINSLQSIMDDLNNYQVGTLERSGVINYDPGRRVPFWEQHRKAQVRSGSDNLLRLTSGSADVQNLRVNGLGMVRRERTDKFGAKTLEAVADDDLTFDDLTALQTLVGRGTAEGAQKRWAAEFWDVFPRQTALSAYDLPFPILDALASGSFPIASTHPAAERLRQQIDLGTLSAISLAKKLEWARKNWQNYDGTVMAELSLFDLEKALNLRLTDKAGRPNGMGLAIRAFNEQTAMSGLDLTTPRSPNVGLDLLFNLALGRSGAITDVEKQFMRDTFDEGLRGADNMARLDDEGGIGVIYHALSEPTDTEMKVAQLAANRKQAFLNELLSSSNTMIKSVSDAAARDVTAFEGARNMAALFYDPSVSNVRLTQVTHAHRHQAALAHAHTVGQNAQRAADELKDTMIRPIVDMVQDLLKQPHGATVLGEVSNTKHILERGVGLRASHYVPGLNELDLERNGARRLINDFFGDLQGLPSDPKTPVNMFDVNIAVREGRYVPIELSEDAANLLNRITDVSYYELDALNALRKFQGRTPINKLNGHLQVDDFSRYSMRYIKDETDRVIGYVKARSDKDADAALAQAIASYNARNPGKTVNEATIAEISQYYDAADQPFNSQLRNMSGYGQTGQTKGRAFDVRLDLTPDTLEAMLIGMRNTFDDLKNRTLGSLFSDSVMEGAQIKRRMGHRAASGAGRSFFDPVDQWSALLQAKRNRPAESSIGKAHDWIETNANAALGKLQEFLPRRMEIVNAILNRDSTALASRYTKKEIKEAEDFIDKYTPWSGLTNRSDLRDALKLTPEQDTYKLARSLQRANRLAGAVFLKFANIAHPILNVTGILATMPSTIRHIQKLPNESDAAWRSRVGPIADYFDPATGVATVSSHKLIAEALHLVHNDEAAYAFAMKRGYLNANLLEELNAGMGALLPSKLSESVEAFAKQADVLNTWMINPAMKKVSGRLPSAHTVSERSETYTRAWAHMVGVALGRRSGMTEEQAHALGFKIANQNIADFAPNIRGEAFQGLAGIPFGLFQSYGINILQRLFGYVENRESRALLNAAFMQTAMFGAQSLPGWPVLNELYFNSKDSKPDERGATSLNERIYNALGKEWADLLMTGAPSSFWHLFGNSGINLYTSGDINPRLPTVPPALSLLTQTSTGIYRSLQAGLEELPKVFTEGVDADFSRIPEIMANYVPIRGVRSMLDLAIGEKVDRNGNLVNDDTRNFVGIVSRLLGTRTTNEMQMSGALWQNSQAQAQRVADMNKVRNEILGHLRARDLTNEELKYYLARYLLAGGREDQWAKWLNYSADKARKTKDERALQKLILNTGEILPMNAAGVGRIANAGADLTPFVTAQP